MKNTTEYKFPTNANESEQFDYICSMIEDIEENTCGELIFGIGVDFKGHFHVEIFEHPEDEDEENELVDWYVGKNGKELFDFLMDKYL